MAQIHLLRQWVAFLKRCVYQCHILLWNTTYTQTSVPSAINYNESSTWLVFPRNSWWSLQELGHRRPEKMVLWGVGHRPTMKLPFCGIYHDTTSWDHAKVWYTVSGEAGKNGLILTEEDFTPDTFVWSGKRGCRPSFWLDCPGETHPSSFEWRVESIGLSERFEASQEGITKLRRNHWRVSGSVVFVVVTTPGRCWLCVGKQTR